MNRIENKFSFKHEQDGDVVKVTTSELSATEVLRRFYSFMLGVGYAEASILDAFQNLRDEHEANNTPMYVAESSGWPNTDPNDGGMNL